MTKSHRDASHGLGAAFERNWEVGTVLVSIGKGAIYIYKYTRPKVYMVYSVYVYIATITFIVMSFCYHYYNKYIVYNLCISCISQGIMKIVGEFPHFG